jgi:tRNA pseudouridine32 synthase / 23S rRNA pseudouridine746 synthase
MEPDLAFLHIDDALLAVNKPPGLRTIPDGYDRSLPYLSGLLQERFGQVWVVHRLDKDTSGVILFARTAQAHRTLNDQFAQRQTGKIYHAILTGQPEWNEIDISLPLRVNGDRKHRTVVDHQSGKAAHTHARVLQNYGNFTLVAAEPSTGYTHQIRAHLSALGLPLLGDPLYKSLCPESEAIRQAREWARSLPMQRTALHAWQITFQHPASGEAVTLHAPYPDDFESTLKVLEANFGSAN